MLRSTSSCRPPLAVAAALLVSAASPAPAVQIHLVDDDGGRGVHFVDLPPAIAAARPGDVLLVRAGAYSSFVLDKGLRVLGEPGVQVAGPLASAVRSVPFGQVAVLSRLRVAELHVESCAGTVVLQDLDTWQLRLDASADVRVAHLPASPGMEPQVSVQAARLELVGCSLRGARGLDSWGWGDAGAGQPALSAGADARVHATHVVMRGGNGGNMYGDTMNRAGDGGPAVLAQGAPAAARVVLAGTNWELVRGGDGGISDSCALDGRGGPGVRSLGALVLHSRVQFAGGDSQCYGSAPPVEGASVIELEPEIVRLELLDEPRAGRWLRFVVHAPPGSTGELAVGDEPLVGRSTDLIEERVQARRLVPIFPVQGGGKFVGSVRVSPNAVMGSLVLAQARLSCVCGRTQRSNSVVGVVR